MSIKSIIFSTEMVQAILAGNKTQTRRVISPQPIHRNPDNDVDFHTWVDGYASFGDDDERGICGRKPRYQPGDILWVKETFFQTWVMDDIPFSDGDAHKKCFFKADHPNIPNENPRWSSPVRMPKAQTRIFLKVTGVRVEQLQEISSKDCVAEGVESEAMEVGDNFTRGIFSGIWDAVNAKRGFGWDTNPWVWVYEFERCDKPEGWPGVKE